MPSPDVGWRPRGGQRERSGAGGELRRLEVSLVAGEETRSRETRENAKMTARHLVPLRAALGAGDGMGTGCGDHDGIHGKFHGASAFGGEYTARAQHLSLVFDHRSLMEHDLPSHFCVLPEGGAAGLAYLVLNQRVGEEIDADGELAAMKVTGLPDV